MQEKGSAKKAVLIIEDETNIRKFVSRICLLEGFDALEAGDGESGLQEARKNHVSMVLLDLRLPGKSGWEVLSELKKDPALSGVPVVIMTASTGDEEKDTALRAGAADYIVKPVGAAVIRNTLSGVMLKRG